MPSIHLLHFFRMASGLVAVLAATSLQESELPYLIIIASRTSGEASARTLSASMAASAAEIVELYADISETKSPRTNCARCLRRRLTSNLQNRERTALTSS